MTQTVAIITPAYKAQSTLAATVRSLLAKRSDSAAVGSARILAADRSRSGASPRTARSARRRFGVDAAV